MRHETMTAVSVQHQTSPPPSDASNHHLHGDSASAQFFDHRQTTRDHRPDMAAPTEHDAFVPGGAAAMTNGETSRFKTQPNGSPERDRYSNNDAEERRLLSANGHENGAQARDDFDPKSLRRPVKPSLQRSKSDYVSRRADDTDLADEDIPEWGARHGFEDHYQSEHIISQLASVSSHLFHTSYLGRSSVAGGTSLLIIAMLVNRCKQELRWSYWLAEARLRWCS